MNKKNYLVENLKLYFFDLKSFLLLKKLRFFSSSRHRLKHNKYYSKTNIIQNFKTKNNF